MRLALVALFLCVVALSSCTLRFNAYIRNFTKNHIIIDISLLRGSEWKTLPNSVKTANTIVNFKGSYKRSFESIEYVNWISPLHFQMTLKPGSSIDLSDLAGEFYNGHPRKNVRVVILRQDRSDTLINGRRDFKRELFKFKGRVSQPIIYYDVE